MITKILHYLKAYCFQCYAPRNLRFCNKCEYYYCDAHYRHHPCKTNRGE